MLRRLAATGLGVGAASRWLPSFAQQLAAHPDRKRQCILLWMAGGPSQLDTFDPKPGHANGGEFKDIATSSAGLRICEHLPKLAQQGQWLTPVRSLTTKEGDHARGAYLVRTGQRPGGPLRYPDIGAALSKELASPDSELPPYVSIGSPVFLNPSAFSPGFLGPSFAPATVGLIPEANNDATAEFPKLGLDYLRSGGERMAWRREMWRRLQDDFLASRQAANAATQDTVYQRAMRLMESPAAKAFDLGAEPDAVRERYGRSFFGQGCLLARRLIEHGVPFAEVSLGGEGLQWDTHQGNFPAVRQLCEQLDAGWSSLMSDLHDRGLLETTTILWIGEFGRTPEINEQAGRDHFPAAWTCVFGGGGIRGGQAYGKTSDDGREVVDGQTGVEDVLATLCQALGVDPGTENLTSIGRPIRISEGAPLRDILAG